MMLSRLLSALVAPLLVLALTSCGGEDTSDPDATASEKDEASAGESSAGESDPATASATPSADDAEETLREYIAAYSSGDVACELSLPAYGQASVESAVEQDGVKPGATCEDVMKWGHDLMTAYGLSLDPKGLTVTVKGDKATAPATYDGEKFTYFLTFVDGRWLVSGDSDEGYFG